MFFTVSLGSLRQMQQNKIDLQAVEEETNAKISAVNKQKLAIVEEYLSHMKVRLSVHSLAVSAWTKENDFILRCFVSHCCLCLCAGKGKAEYGEGVFGPSERRSRCRKNQAGDRLQRKFG